MRHGGNRPYWLTSPGRPSLKTADTRNTGTGVNEYDRHDANKYINIDCQLNIKALASFYLWSLLRAVLQHSVKDLHVIRIPGVRQFIKNHQLHHGA